MQGKRCMKGRDSRSLRLHHDSCAEYFGRTRPSDVRSRPCQAKDQRPIWRELPEISDGAETRAVRLLFETRQPVHGSGSVQALKSEFMGSHGGLVVHTVEQTEPCQLAKSCSLSPYAIPTVHRAVARPTADDECRLQPSLTGRTSDTNMPFCRCSQQQAQALAECRAC